MSSFFKTLNILRIVLIFLVGNYESVTAKENETVRIFTSHGYLPAVLIHKFEQETGLKVLIDVFDSDDVLEAKLLSGATGYDLVFPSAWPYLVRQVSSGFYQPFDPAQIPNLQNIDPYFLQSLEGPEQADKYAVPFMWGLIGFAYNVDEIQKRVPEAPLDSWAMFFDPDIIRKLAPCGVAMLDEPADLMIGAKAYLGIDPGSESKEDLERVIQVFQKIRPFIRRFDISRSNDEIANGEMCLVQHWLGAVIASSEHLGPHERQATLKLVIPKEGSVMWIDVMAIPKSAPHPELAHRFINFLLEPENIAVITNETYFANPVPKSLPYVQADIRENKAIFPDPEVFKRVIRHKKSTSLYQKRLTRAFTKIRSGR